MVHGLGVVHLVDGTHGLDGEENNLTVGILSFWLQCDELSEGACLQGLVVGHYLGELLCGVGPGIKHFRGDAAVVFAHKVQQLCRLAGLVFSKALCTEVPGVVEEIIDIISLGIPCHVHEQLDGILHGLQVADVQDPQFLDTAVVGQLQLFPHILYRGDVDPFRVAGGTDVVYVVVESPAAFALLFLSGGQTAHVAPVVVTQQYRHVVGHTESGVVVVLYLFI